MTGNEYYLYGPTRPRQDDHALDPIRVRDDRHQLKPKIVLLLKKLEKKSVSCARSSIGLDCQSHSPIILQSYRSNQSRHNSNLDEIELPKIKNIYNTIIDHFFQRIIK